ncbi:DUF2938 domain-containing protein [Caldimonas sp. KR1-144]|uniref:DUF2938 domain-containing protein n=1 Tax=Caldimonas sp. KR1-144 TaxID=3400911 RepID=UPI003C03A00B
MLSFLQDGARIALIGIGATALMDLWLVLLKRLGVPTLDFALIGRWLGHGLGGKWTHQAIGRAAPVRGELALGWLVHYAVGVAFAGVLVAAFGLEWAKAPTPLPALCVGIGTVAAPLLVLQPAMGAGFASSKTATPARNCLRSLINHCVFGAGLYLSAASIAWLWH